MSGITLATAHPAPQPDHVDITELLRMTPATVNSAPSSPNAAPRGPWTGREKPRTVRNERFFLAERPVVLPPPTCRPVRSDRSARADQAGLVGEDDKLGPVPGSELGHRPAGVGFYRCRADVDLAEISSLDSAGIAEAARAPTCITRLDENSPCAGLAGPSGGGTVEQVRSCRVGPGRGLVAPDPGDVIPERCARKTPRRTERRRQQHQAFLPCRPAAPQLQTGCLLPSILRRRAFVHWRCRCGRWVCSTAGRATTG